MYKSHVPRRQLYPAMGDGSVRPTRSAHVQFQRPMRLLRASGRSPQYGGHVGCLWRNGNGVFVPDLPGDWVLACAVVLPCGGVYHAHQVKGAESGKFH